MPSAISSWHRPETGRGDCDVEQEEIANKRLGTAVKSTTFIIDYRRKGGNTRLRAKSIRPNELLADFGSRAIRRNQRP